MIESGWDTAQDLILGHMSEVGAEIQKKVSLCSCGGRPSLIRDTHDWESEEVSRMISGIMGSIRGRWK